MFIRVDFNLARTIFANYGRADQFSDDALRMILDHYDSIEDDESTTSRDPFHVSGVLFDCIAICCEWTEYGTIREAVEAFTAKSMTAPEALDYLNDRGLVLYSGKWEEATMDSGPVVLSA